MYQKSQQENGLRVVTHDINDRASIALGFWVGVGGRYEKDNVKGAAHFLEHIVFKGSQKYSCEEIKIKIEGVGGTLNAFTSEEQTCFYAKIPAKHLEQTFDVLADMVFYPKIQARDVAKESTVIIEEIKMYHDLPQYQVMDMLDGLFWPGHPLGKSLIGSADSVGNMTNKDLKGFHQAHYRMNNIVIAACGRLKHNDIADLVKKKLHAKSAILNEGYIPASSEQEAPKTNFFKKDTEQMHVALGVLGYHENHPSRYAQSILSIILGGNMSSRLFVEVREKRGLAYSVSCSAKTLHDTGAMIVRAGVDNTKLLGAVDLILKELSKIQKSGVKDDEFNRAKDYLLGQLLLGLEDTMEHMLWLGESLIAKNEIRTMQSVVDKVNAVTPADIQRAAKDLLASHRLNLAVVGPLTDPQIKSLSKTLNF